MNATLKKALDKAEAHINSFTLEDNSIAYRKELEKLNKKDLIDRLMLAQAKPTKVKIQDVVYAILEDPDCAWLTWDTLAALITSKIPGSKSTPESLRWYPSEGMKNGRDIVARKPMKDIIALLTAV